MLKQFILPFFSALLMVISSEVKSQKINFGSEIPLIKKAIIIGESAYAHYDTLQNAIADADTMERVLREMGFEVQKHLNLKSREVACAIKGWSDSIRSGDFTLFYFSGHGVQAMGKDFMVPVDAVLYDSIDVRRQCYNLDRLINLIEGSDSKGNLIFFDACREDILGNRSTSASYSNLKKTCIGFASESGKGIVQYRGSTLSTYTAVLAAKLNDASSMSRLLHEVAMVVWQHTSSEMPTHINVAFIDSLTCSLK